jgi:DNA-binding PadR family transcriptional regulator
MTLATASRLEYALLGLIRQGARSGYELRKQFSTTPMGHFSDSPGSIYPALKRLEERGWIRLLDEDGGPRGRQVYRLTGPGQAVLKGWMAMPVGREDVVRRPDELLLRFAFMGEVSDRVTVVAFLEAFEREAAGYVRELRSFLAALPEGDLPTGRLALENGLAQYQTQVRWARRALARLRRSK